MKDKRPKAIGFDIDNTLYEYEICNTYAQEKTLQYASEKFNIEISQFKKKLKVAKANVKTNLKNTGSSHSRLLYFHEMLALMKITDSYEAIRLESIFWREYLSKIKANPGLKKFLKILKKHKVKTYILTDLTTAIQIRKLKKMELHDSFDLILTSEFIGEDKPCLDGFKLASKRLNFNLNESWYIGDSFEKDYAPCELLGIKPYLISKKVNFYDIKFFFEGAQ